MTRRILVTGASGFIGRHAMRHLAGSSDEVLGVGRRDMEAPPGTAYRRVDLLAPGAPQEIVARFKPTHLLHLAWDVTPPHYWRSLANLKWEAVALGLFEAFAANGGRRAVLAGTCAEYDWSCERLDEISTPCRPATLYGTVKDALRQVVEVAAGVSGVSTAWGRIFLLYGPFEPPGRLISDLARSLLSGERFACSAGTQRRDMMHVADVAGAFAALLDSRVEGPVNIATGECRPLADAISLVGELTGRADLIDFGMRPMAANDPPRLEASVGILRDQVGFRPRFDLAGGLADTVAWWRGR